MDDQGNEYILVDFLPIMQLIEYFMCSILLKITKSCNILAIKYWKRMLKVEMTNICNKSHLFPVLLSKLL